MIICDKITKQKKKTSRVEHNIIPVHKFTYEKKKQGAIEIGASVSFWFIDMSTICINCSLPTLNYVMMHVINQFNCGTHESSHLVKDSATIAIALRTLASSPVNRITSPANEQTINVCLKGLSFAPHTVRNITTNITNHK